MVKYKSLFQPETLAEIQRRILELKEDAKAKWGKMNSAQMLCHCDKVLKVAIGKLILPKTNFFIYYIGNLTKWEMRIFNNGIPPNMPTFKKLVVEEICNFEECRENLLKTLNEFIRISSENKLPERHELFGKMTKKEWGFMEYKHLNHHLKQFGL